MYYNVDIRTELVGKYIVKNRTLAWKRVLDTPQTYRRRTIIRLYIIDIINYREPRGARSGICVYTVERALVKRNIMSG